MLLFPMLCFLMHRFLALLPIPSSGLFADSYRFRLIATLWVDTSAHSKRAVSADHVHPHHHGRAPLPLFPLRSLRLPIPADIVPSPLRLSLQREQRPILSVRNLGFFLHRDASPFHSLLRLLLLRLRLQSPPLPSLLHRSLLHTRFDLPRASLHSLLPLDEYHPHPT